MAMLWGKQDEPPVPEILKGKTPEQIADALSKYQELERKHSEVAAKQSEAERQLQEHQTQFQQMQQRVAQMEQERQQREAPPPDDATIWADPDKYIDNKLSQAQQPALYSGALTAKMYAVNTLSPRDKRIFAKYERDIDKMIDGLTPQQRMLPQSWLMCLTMAKGQHDREIADAERDHTDFFSESGRTGVEPPPAEPPADKLNEDEENVCRVMHWDRDAYLKQKKLAEMRQSDRGGYMHFGTESISRRRDVGR